MLGEIEIMLGEKYVVSITVAIDLSTVQKSSTDETFCVLRCLQRLLSPIAMSNFQ